MQAAGLKLAEVLSAVAFGISVSTQVMSEVLASAPANDHDVPLPRNLDAEFDDCAVPQQRQANYRVTPVTCRWPRLWKAEAGANRDSAEMLVLWWQLDTIMWK